MHYFNNYFDYIIYIILSNLLYFTYFFRLSINKERGVEKMSKFGFYLLKDFTSEFIKSVQKIMNYEKHYSHNDLFGLGFRDYYL